MKVEVIAHTNDAEKYIAAAAKLCYSKSGIDDIVENIDDKTMEYYVDMLTEMGHESVLEHASYTFAIEGVSRALLAQITRHRIASFSVQSQRYVNMSDFKYITPPAIANNPEALDEFMKAVEEDKKRYDNIAAILTKEHFMRICKEKNIFSGNESVIAKEYESLRSSGGKNNKNNKENKNIRDIFRQAVSLANEDARFVLPNACETRLVMTMNARSLLNFFKLRTCQRAQWEIRNLAGEMIKRVKETSPLLFKKAGPPCVCYGFCTEGKMSCGNAREMREKFGVPENN